MNGDAPGTLFIQAEPEEGVAGHVVHGGRVGTEKAKDSGLFVGAFFLNG